MQSDSPVGGSWVNAVAFYSCAIRRKQQRETKRNRRADTTRANFFSPSLLLANSKCPTVRHGGATAVITDGQINIAAGRQFAGGEEKYVVDALGRAKEFFASFPPSLPQTPRTQISLMFAVSGIYARFDTPGFADRDGLEGDVDPDCWLMRNAEHWL